MPPHQWGGHEKGGHIDLHNAKLGTRVPYLVFKRKTSSFYQGWRFRLLLKYGINCQP